MSFGANQSIASSVTSTTLMAHAPSGSAGEAVAVTVIDETTSVAASGSLTFTYIGPPTVASISPSQGSTAGGTAVTITGSGFIASESYSATFGSTSVTATYASATTITATTPAGSAGAATVKVEDTTASVNATGSASFTYITPAAVTSIAPNSGPIAGGTAVTITGAGFISGHGYSATFGSTTLAATYASGTTLIATTPAESAGTVFVTVMDTTTGVPASGSATYSFGSAGTLS